MQSTTGEYINSLQNSIFIHDIYDLASSLLDIKISDESDLILCVIFYCYSHFVSTHEPRSERPIISH
jgi:hypothetical protein